MQTPTPATEKLGISGRIAATFQDNAITPLLALVALLLGFFAVMVTPREEEPQINVTMANVLIAFPGASSQDVQNMVARPAEQVLSQIAGIEHTYSVARPGIAILTVQFKVGVARTEALVRLYDVLNANQDWLPRELGALPPIVKPKGIDDVPVLAVTLWSKEMMPGVELEQVARNIEQEIKAVPGAREVQTIGGPGRAIHVWLDPGRLRERGVDLLSLKNTISAANFRMPSGTVLERNEGTSQMLVVESGEFLRSADDIGDLIVGVSKGKPVYLREVARIEAGAQLPQRYVWFTPGAASSDAATDSATGNVYPAITMTVTKKPGENAVDVATAARERVESLRNTLIPANVEMTITRDYGETAAEKANKLIQKLAFATASVILLVGFALGKREAVIVGSAVILTLTATLFASWAWGFTLNRVSLFALIFSIGILVDDAIVVVENIHRHQALDPGKTLREIIPGAVDEVGGPTILATMTVIAALLPMAFVSGLMGPYMSPIPINSSLGMAISLAIAFTVTPWLSLKLMKAHAGHAVGSSAEPATKATRLQRLFSSVLDPLLASARKRWLLLAGILVALMLSVGLTMVQWVVLKMLPFDNKSEFQVIVDMPAGTPLYTKDLKPLSYVFGDMAGKLDSPLYGLFAIRPKLEIAALPGTGTLGEYWIRQPSDTYREYAIKWDGEWQITYETFRDMGAAYGVGLILIYLLVVAQFKSYTTPLVIMAPIPLTMIGVMPGHALLGAQFTATSMIGMIALAGIIVRNSILLVDFIELQVARGVPFRDAVVQSAAVRAQPIALTGLAAMIGAFFILDDPIFNGLAISLIFGILVSTVLTLVVIPVMYFAMYRKQHLVHSPGSHS